MRGGQRCRTSTQSLSSSSEAGLHRSTESDTECQRQNDCL